MPLKHTLLGLLDKEAMHGYKLRKRAGEFSWIYPMTNASIYPALHALEGDGLISHESEIHNGRARKIYHITDAGRAKLHSWLNEAPEHTLSLRDQMLLRIVFQGKEHSDSSLGWIRGALEDLKQEISQFEASAASRSHETPGMKLAEEFGMDILRLRADLFEKLLRLPQQESASGKKPYPENRENFATA